MEEGEQINEQIRRQFEGAGDMVDGLSRIVTHDERVSSIRFTTVRAAWFRLAMPARVRWSSLTMSMVFPFSRVSHQAGVLREKSIPILSGAITHSGGVFFRNSRVQQYVPPS